MFRMVKTSDNLRINKKLSTASIAFLNDIHVNLKGIHMISTFHTTIKEEFFF